MHLLMAIQQQLQSSFHLHYPFVGLALLFQHRPKEIRSVAFSQTHDLLAHVAMYISTTLQLLMKVMRAILLKKDLLVHGRFWFNLLA